jgi:hypothetical protein
LLARINRILASQKCVVQWISRDTAIDESASQRLTVSTEGHVMCRNIAL